VSLVKLCDWFGSDRSKPTVFFHLNDNDPNLEFIHKMEDQIWQYGKLEFIVIVEWCAYLAATAEIMVPSVDQDVRQTNIVI
jgi:hypothetical protein